MVRIIKESPFLEMAKLTKKYTDDSLCGDFGDFIYFSPCQDAHVPRVKFYGGTVETGTTRKSPTLAFTNDGDTTVELERWMNKKNCPNAFDDEYVDKVERFVQRFLPILLLVWYNKLDESHALHFFEGSIPLSELIEECTGIDEIIYNELVNVKTIKELHWFCENNNLYKFN